MTAPPLAPPGLPRLAQLIWARSQEHWRFVVIAMLALLHIAVVRGVSDPWARALLLAHLGLLLLWQPFVRAEQRVSPAQGLVLSLGALAVMLRLDWWLLAFWVVILAGLVGGKVYQQQARWQRRTYFVVFLYLLALLAVVILPQVAPFQEIAPEIRAAADYGLPLFFVAIAFFPSEPERAEAAQVIDFFYSVFLMLVLVTVILGSFTLMNVRKTSYLHALSITVLLTGGVFLMIALAWNPRSGFSGLNVFFSRYLFSIGLPMERWLHFLAELAQVEARPERFMEEAVGALARLPWVSGVQWSAGERSGMEGERTEYDVGFENSAVSLRLYSSYRIGPALHWHLHLLGLLLGEFYLAKLREQALREASYLQAVHETGARMTHDIKNLLQSLNVLCSAAERQAHDDSPAFQALIRRQLPVIAQRLTETLGKLQRPQQVADLHLPAAQWWETLRQRYRGEGVSFADRGLEAAGALPRSLFDTVADNLVRNALAKRSLDPELTLRISLSCSQGVISLSVCDTGHAVLPEVEASLLRSPVPSASGLGIGLFQAARLAEAGGFALRLESNQEGRVCFVLEGRADSAAREGAAR
ncbi:MAG: sensor histidine kinase [Betaproteobacteria bacterium]|nr:sensor histidine kinase [Betaproteobacteria bacterium]